MNPQHFLVEFHTVLKEFRIKRFDLVLAENQACLKRNEHSFWLTIAVAPDESTANLKLALIKQMGNLRSMES